MVTPPQLQLQWSILWKVKAVGTMLLPCALLILWTIILRKKDLLRCDDSDQLGQCVPCDDTMLHISCLCKHGCYITMMYCILPLDELDRLKGFIHVTNSQVEAEVQHGITSFLLTVLQPNKISKSSPGHHVGALGRSLCCWLTVMWRKRSFCGVWIPLTWLNNTRPSRKIWFWDYQLCDLEKRMLNGLVRLGRMLKFWGMGRVR